MSKITEIFGSMVFDETVMKNKLPRDVYGRLEKHIADGSELPIAVADVIASAVKDWAEQKGATHFTHWFQPMTGVTAEKHDSLMNFSGKNLIKGEPDASSFPSSGMRATFEARGYTAWDTSSPMFIKEDTLYIPTAFISYDGDALDKKTPLLRSDEAIDVQSRRVLSALGEDVKKVTPQIGPEQEYFLIPKSLYAKRKDLIFTGRTLIGAAPPKSQELDDHYFGQLKPAVKAFMADLDEELWKLGVKASTEHNEVAPSQHELAPIFSECNIASDHNQITMELMKKVADRHGMRCLLHEKPFDGINGSGKHINWSLAADTGLNVFKPGHDPLHNTVFLVFMTAVIKAVDKYQDMLRISVASASNDHRLGGSEAPPAIISIFLGEDITAVMDAFEAGESEVEVKDRRMSMGIGVLTDFKKDTTDRNRTSPFAFTGNRFEFRMVGSLTSVSCPAYMLNTMTASVLKEFADAMEASDDAEACAMELAKKAYSEHKRIVFNGDNYTDEWVREAEKRGLKNYKTVSECMPEWTSEKNIELFTSLGVLTEKELRARQEILFEEYCKELNIEALTLLDMTEKDLIPAVRDYCTALAEGIGAQTAALGEDISGTGKRCLKCMLSITDDLYSAAEDLKEVTDDVPEFSIKDPDAKVFCDSVIEYMKDIRTIADELEVKMPEKYWPIPTYGEMLFAQEYK